jgi:hypothetical protein
MMGNMGKVFTIRRIIGVGVILLVAALGVYFLASSNAQTPIVRPVAQPIGKIQPEELGVVPYQYIAYSGSLEQSRQTTGVQKFFAAFIISQDNACAPAWGGVALNGIDSKRATDISADFDKVRAAGGDVFISLGGSHGTELASSCTTTADLTAAYQKIIDKYKVTRLDMDIEGPMLVDGPAGERRAAALKELQRNNPGLKVQVTLPVDAKGLTTPGVDLLRQFGKADVTITTINLMTMSYNIKSKEMGNQSVKAAEAAYSQLRSLYPDMSEDDLWRAVGLTVMPGYNTTPDEIFTLSDARLVREFADQRGIGLISMWSLGRDAECTDTKAPQPRDNCSGVKQAPLEFLRTLQGA